jgi:hypothetical protein
MKKKFSIFQNTRDLDLYQIVGKKFNNISLVFMKCLKKVKIKMIKYMKMRLFMFFIILKISI